MRHWHWFLRIFLVASALLLIVATWRSSWHAKYLSEPVEIRSFPDELPGDYSRLRISEGRTESGDQSPSAHPKARSIPYELIFSKGYLPSAVNGEPPLDAPSFSYVAIGDVTGDGRSDLVAYGRYSEAALYVFAQLADGTLDQAAVYPIETPTAVIGFSLKDMNNDRIADLVITFQDGVSVGLFDSTGGLKISSIMSIAPEKKEMDVAVVTLDLNNDGNQDVIAHFKVAYASSDDTSEDRRSRFRIIYGDGAGGSLKSKDFGIFGEDTSDYGDYDVETLTSLVVGDFNGDRYSDIALASRRFDFGEQQNPPFLSIYSNDQNDNLVGPQLIKANIGYGVDSVVLENLAVGDFSNDRRQDFAASEESNLTHVFIFLQGLSGKIKAQADYNFSSGPIVRASLGLDLDADGRDDLLVGNSNWGSIGYHLQKSGVLTQEVRVGLSGFAGYQLDGGIAQGGLAAGDLNSDGCPDVAVAASYNGLQVFSGRHCARRAVTGGRLPASQL